MSNEKAPHVAECGNCAYFHTRLFTASKDAEYTVCVRRSPTPCSSSNLAVWPIVDNGMWCGEHAWRPLE